MAALGERLDALRQHVMQTRHVGPESGEQQYAPHRAARQAQRLRRSFLNWLKRSKR
jgi:hypothetical protein